MTSQKTQYHKVYPFFFACLLNYIFFETFFSFFRKIFYEKKNPLYPDKKHLHMLVFSYFKTHVKTTLSINFFYILTMVVVLFFFSYPGLFKNFIYFTNTFVHYNLFTISCKKKMKKPLVSVIMPAYNASLFITSSVQSIKDQTLKNWELIIINDGSTDNTLEILKKIKNRKIKIINQKKNIGPYKSINNHINKCKGKFIAFLDADDVSNNKRLKIQSDFLITHKNFSLVGSNFKYIDTDGNFIKKNNGISIKEFNKTFPCQNCIANSSVMLRKEIFKEIYFLDKEFFYANDYILLFENF